MIKYERKILKSLENKKHDYNDSIKNLEFCEQGMEHNYNVIDTYKALILLNIFQKKIKLLILIHLNY